LKLILATILLIVFIAGGAAAWMWYGMTKPYQDFRPKVFSSIYRTELRAGMRLHTKKNGVIRSATAFEIYARRNPKRTLQAGEYFFDHAATGKDVSGNLPKETFTSSRSRCAKARRCSISPANWQREIHARGRFSLCAGDTALIRGFAPGAQTLEGFLFPATYQLPRHPSASELTAEMVRKFKEEWKRVARLQPKGKWTKAATPQCFES